MVSYPLLTIIICTFSSLPAEKGPKADGPWMLWTTTGKGLEMLSSLLPLCYNAINASSEQCGEVCMLRGFCLIVRQGRGQRAGVLFVTTSWLTAPVLFKTKTLNDPVGLLTAPISKAWALSGLAWLLKVVWAGFLAALSPLHSGSNFSDGMNCLNITTAYIAGLWLATTQGIFDDAGLGDKEKWAWREWWENKQTKKFPELKFSSQFIRYWLKVNIKQKLGGDSFSSCLLHQYHYASPVL